MTDLVRDHVGLRELATLASNIATAKSPLDILEKRSVQVNLLVERTVERPHRRLRNPAAGARAPGEHDERRRLIGLSRLGENLAPLHFRAPQHSRYEILHLIGRLCRGLIGCGLRLLRRTAKA